MWGPANALSDGNSASDQQGLAPRVFERLFACINEVVLSSILFVIESFDGYMNFVVIFIVVFHAQEQIKHSDKQLKYQCHCSFLEVELNDC